MKSVMMAVAAVLVLGSTAFAGWYVGPGYAYYPAVPAYVYPALCRRTLLIRPRHTSHIRLWWRRRSWRPRRFGLAVRWSLGLPARCISSAVPCGTPFARSCLSAGPDLQKLWRHAHACRGHAHFWRNPCRDSRPRPHSGLSPLTVRHFARRPPSVILGAWAIVTVISPSESLPPRWR